MSLRQYIYISTALELQEDDIRSILESCMRHNKEKGVTGLLLYNGRNFLQLLEGEEADLKWVLDRIKLDARHSGISTLEDEPCEQRACPDWLMRHIRLLDDVEDRRKRLDEQLPEVLNPRLRRIILNFASLN
ncbi:BLUF domain-containing protein [Pontixanthobacter aquaemixtae]|uniref:BLUF domain-containing protein n=1 Tax=Pontixanthobacter aquaemixtae TaxID=1958940 RepID=A0A844ZXD4_9SPHN|nr:BLUF domain-containing protein [Pontixanthobacter aquaemixtae]MXO91417.1 hypothetical protein [Pontixanthobacter aquaemixtae]